jgi:hypothetical protein
VEGFEYTEGVVRATVVDKEKPLGMPGTNERFECVDLKSLGFVVTGNDDDG